MKGRTPARLEFLSPYCPTTRSANMWIEARRCEGKGHRLKPLTDRGVSMELRIMIFDWCCHTAPSEPGGQGAEGKIWTQEKRRDRGLGKIARKAGDFLYQTLLQRTNERDWNGLDRVARMGRCETLKNFNLKSRRQENTGQNCWLLGGGGDGWY